MCALLSELSASCVAGRALGLSCLFGSIVGGERLIYVYGRASWLKFQSGDYGVLSLEASVSHGERFLLVNWVIQQRGPPPPVPRTHIQPQAGKQLWSHIAPSCWKAWGFLASTPRPFLLKLHNHGFHHSATERSQDQGSHRPGVFVA